VSTLHVTNGSSAGDTLATVIQGPVIITCDVLHEGPAPRVDGDAWYNARARFLANQVGSDVDQIRADLARTDRAIVGHRADIVLWFEHDLFDQLLLIRTLDLLARPKDAKSAGSPSAASGFGETLSSGSSRTVSLICIDRFPGVDRFIGLGQLSADQLVSLYPTRKPVTTAQYAIASEAWQAFRSADPTEVLRVTVRLFPSARRGSASSRGNSARPRGSDGGGADATSRPTDAASDGDGLPFLRDALLRFLAEYPSTANGLSRTEDLALRALSGAPMTAGQLFAATQKQEARPFMGDLPFYDLLRGLASAHVPLVALHAAERDLNLRDVQVSITAAGRDVVAGRRDHVAQSGIDRWKGGVHLTGTDRSPWRWDAARETLVS